MHKILFFFMLTNIIPVCWSMQHTSDGKSESTQADALGFLDNAQKIQELYHQEQLLQEQLSAAALYAAKPTTLGNIEDAPLIQRRKAIKYSETAQQKKTHRAQAMPYPQREKLPKNCKKTTSDSK